MTHRRSPPHEPGGHHTEHEHDEHEHGSLEAEFFGLLLEDVAMQGKLDRIFKMLIAIRKDYKNMSAETLAALAALKVDVQEERGAVTAILALVAGFSGQLQALVDQLTEANADGPAAVAAIAELKTDIDSQTEALAAAVVAGTPAA